jgi:hypothetical protein
LVLGSPNASGLFSVGSAYDLAAKNIDATSGPLSTSDWNGLWSLKMQHRHKHLLWRIAWNVLPVRVNLFKFMPHVSRDEWICPICNGPQETIQHIFLDCIVAKAIWRSSPWALDTSVFAGMPISEWIKALINPHYFLNISCEDVQKFQLSAVIVLDAIWRVRNDKVHNGSVIDLQGIIAQIRSTFDIHSRVWVDKSMGESWSCPPVGAIKFLFSSFSSWSATKVSRSINLRAHLVAKWAASHNVYGSIPTSLPFLVCCKNQEWT